MVEVVRVVDWKVALAVGAVAGLYGLYKGYNLGKKAEKLRRQLEDVDWSKWDKMAHDWKK